MQFRGSCWASSLRRICQCLGILRPKRIYFRSYIWSEGSYGISVSIVLSFLQSHVVSHDGALLYTYYPVPVLQMFHRQCFRINYFTYTFVLSPPSKEYRSDCWCFSDQMIWCFAGHFVLEFCISRFLFKISLIGFTMDDLFIWLCICY